MKKRNFFGIIAAAMIVPVLHAKEAGVDPATGSRLEKPNILIFYVDDLGWQDVQFNELDTPCPYETPNLVKLAESGMNFPQASMTTDAHSAVRSTLCVRYHVITGLRRGRVLCYSRCVEHPILILS